MDGIKRDLKVLKLHLRSFLSLGDIVCMTPCVRDLKLHLKDQVQISVETSCSQVWDNNPYIVPYDPNDKEVRIIDMHYDDINESNESGRHFTSGYRMFLEDKLDMRIPSKKGFGDLHLSSDEKSWISQVEELGIKDDFWVVSSGGKTDFTCKWFFPKKYQEIVSYFEGKITFVQIGEKKDFHPKLKGVIDLRGKTDIRQLIRLVYNSVGTLSNMTCLSHISGALPSREGYPIRRAGVTVLGGREPATWCNYIGQTVLSNHSALSCCDNGGCWKSRSSLVGDGDIKDKKDTCLFPMDSGVDYLVNGRKIRFRESKCLNMISAKDVIRAIEMYYSGDTLKYGSSVSRENYKNLSKEAQSLIEF